jgi:hypothetical protein
MDRMDLTHVIAALSRIAFASASLVLMAMSFALVIYGASEVILSATWIDAGDALLTGIGYVVIAVAVFDLAKYFIEEEVIRAREMRSPGEARRSLTKFISTICIAVFIEGVVIAFHVSKQDVSLMLYPTALLLSAIVIVVGLGAFQQLSSSVEEKVEQRDRKAQARSKPD